MIKLKNVTKLGTMKKKSGAKEISGSAELNEV